MASLLDEIPLPSGWEKKVDQSSGQTYYIDHARRATQWVDPRLRHPSIWRDQQRQMLDRLSAIFKDAPEDTLRSALITCRFMEINAVNHVANLGYKKSATVVVGQSPTTPSQAAAAHASMGPPAPSGPAPARKPPTSPIANGDFPSVAQTARKSSSPRMRSTAASPKPRNRTSSTTENRPDHFVMLTMKSKFPETSEDIIVDVLNQCGQNVDMATRELMNMGYAGRQRAIDRNIEREFKTDELEKIKKKKQKEDRDQHLRQLKNEFESFLDADIANAFETCSHDLYETRTALRKREAEVRMQALTSNEIRVTANVPAVTVQEGTTTTTIGDTVVTIERRRPSDDTVGNIMTETLIIRPTMKPKISKSTERGIVKFVPDFATKGHTYQPIAHREITSKSSGATPTHHPVGPWVSLAKGPNACLRRGSDPNLRSGSTRALGPDPSLRRGPNPQHRYSVINPQ